MSGVTHRRRPAGPSCPGANPPDRKDRAEHAGNEQAHCDDKHHVIVPYHCCLNAITADTIQAMPPSVPIPAPIPANTLAAVGSDRSVATVTMTAPTVQNIAATRFQASPVTRYDHI